MEVGRIGNHGSAVPRHVAVGSLQGRGAVMLHLQLTVGDSVKEECLKT